MSAELFLKRGKDKPLRNHHPWIFSGAIARVDAERASDGDTVEVYDAAGAWLARASYNSRSQIAARVWTFDREEEIDRAFFKRRLQRALELREAVVGAGHTRATEDRGRTTEAISDLSPSSSVEPANAYRLVNAESDGLPGLVADRYADFLVVQFLTLGAEVHKAEIVGAIRACTWGAGTSESPLHPRGIYERSDVDVRKKEGLPLVSGVLWGEEPPDRIEVHENGLRFLVEVKTGHKTGFYLDQRENRQRALPYLHGEVLNAFAYTGAFGVYAARAGATRVLNLDASEPALTLARENFALNGFEDCAEFMVADAFQKLREFRASGQMFDTIVLDPPKFVFSAGQMERALRGYKDINLLAFQLLRPNGFLVTFSCSGLVSPDLFQKVVFGAAVDAGREAQIVEKLSQAPDHPILLSFPEAEYLKGLIIRVG
jgi:23S rRNA (cytosine1962-C5)-methyltransferase